MGTARMLWLLGAVVILLQLTLLRETFAQAPDDADPFCTVTLPGIGINILDYALEVKPLMDSRHYQNLLPPHANAVWQDVDNDNNNPVGTSTDVSRVEVKHIMGLVYLSFTLYHAIISPFPVDSEY